MTVMVAKILVKTSTMTTILFSMMMIIVALRVVNFSGLQRLQLIMILMVAVTQPKTVTMMMTAFLTLMMIVTLNQESPVN